MEKPLIDRERSRDGVRFTLGSLGGESIFSRKRKTKVRFGVVEDRKKEFP